MSGARGQGNWIGGAIALVVIWSVVAIAIGARIGYGAGLEDADVVIREVCMGSR